MLFGMPTSMLWITNVEESVEHEGQFVVSFAFSDLVWHARTVIVHSNASNNGPITTNEGVFEFIMAWESIWKYSPIGDKRLSFWTLYSVLEFHFFVGGS